MATPRRARAALLNAVLPVATLALSGSVAVAVLPAAPVLARPAARVVAEPLVGTALTAATAAATVPPLPARSGTGRRIVYSISKQRVWTIGGLGRVQRSYLVSGRRSQPLPGTYHVYSKSRWTRSTVSAETMQYMVRFAHGANTGTPIGFHSIPVDAAGHPAQTVAQLGQPLSHGCVRQRLSDAAYLYRFSYVGTKVVVTR